MRKRVDRLRPARSRLLRGGRAFERFINHRCLTCLGDTSAFSLDFKSETFNETPYVGVSLLRAVGIRAGDEAFHANTGILAEGANNLLTRQVGLQNDYVPADHMLVGVKEVIGFDRSVLEDRFQLDGRAG